MLIRGSIALAALAVVLTVDALVRGRSEFDYRLIRTVQEIDFPYLQPVLTFVDLLTSSYWAITLWAALLLYLAIVLRSWLPALTVALIPLGGGVNWVIRQIVDRERPDPERMIRAMAETDSAAFPSGHVVGAVIFYGVIFLLARNIRYWPLRLPIQIAAVIVILLAGPARVWLGAHWVSDVVMAYVLGLSILLALVWFYRKLAAEVGDLPFVHAAEIPFDPSIPQAHALTSTILFQGDIVTKVYAPGFLPRAIYWLSFQAEFPYIRNRAALDAAVYRRNLAGKLTEYWYGSNRVARAFGVVEVDGRLGLASERIEVSGEQDSDAELEFLHDLATRFDEAGLPTWQIDPRQPRGKDNVLHGTDGNFYIVDLESGLASPLASPRAWWRALERADVPLFDTVYFDITREYIERMSPDIRTRMGDEWYDELVALLDRAEQANERWHASEPRIWSRLLRWIESGFGIGRLLRRLREASGANLGRAERLLESMIAAWEAEERISTREAEDIRRTLAEPQVHRVIPHFAVHLTIGIAMRFPVGSILRASYTLLNLLASTIRLLTLKIDRATWRRDFSIHSPLVIVVAGMPAIGTFSYLLSGPIRSNHLLMRIVADAMLMKVPGRLYERLGWRALLARPAGWASASSSSEGAVVFSVRLRLLAIVLGAVGAAMIVAYAILEFLIHAFEPEARWWSDLASSLGVDTGGSLSTWYVVAVLGLTGFWALVIGIVAWLRGQRDVLRWQALGIVTLAVIFEEHLPSLSVTSLIQDALNRDLGLTDWSRAVLWIAIVAIGGFLTYRFVVALPLQLRGLIVIGILFYAGGAIGLELVGDVYGWIFSEGNVEYRMIRAAEELAELLGIVIMFYVVLEFTRLSPGTPRSDPDRPTPPSAA